MDYIIKEAVSDDEKGARPLSTTVLGTETYTGLMPQEF